MTFTLHKVLSTAEWNTRITANPDGGNVFQIAEFAEVKQATGWMPRYLVADSLAILTLEKHVPFFGKLWYIPKGPGITTTNELAKLLPDLKAIAREHGVFAVKLEPELVATPETSAALTTLGLIKARDIQPNTHTVILDITPPLDDIVAGFSSKTRYNIRAAQKADVELTVEPITEASCDIFYDLLIKTIFGRVQMRDRDYYTQFWLTHGKAGTGMFLFARVDGEVVSTDFITMIGHKANRKDAASTRERTVRGVSALLEVEAIKQLKDRGITEYDLCGTPPADQIKNPDHPYYGIGTFKTGFNPDVTDFVGVYDLVVNPQTYKLWHRFGERLVRAFYSRVLKGFFY